MSQTTVTGQQSTLASIVETLSSAWLQRETIKAGQPLGFYSTQNQPSQYEPMTTGTNSDGSTLVAQRWVPGVENRHVLAGVAVLAALGIVIYATAK